jgi:hypothetical protein
MKKKKFEVAWEHFLSLASKEYKENKKEYGCSYAEYMEDYENSKEIVKQFVDYLDTQL